jgi:hypothetical protein
VNGPKAFLQVPWISGRRATAMQPRGRVLPPLPTLWADSGMGHGAAAFA